MDKKRILSTGFNYKFIDSCSLIMTNSSKGSDFGLLIKGKIKLSIYL